ncbi:MAG: PsbP-related protein [Promethearchaeota archaeon]
MKLVPYENKEFNFKIKYPKEWELLDNHPLYAAAFISPHEDGTEIGLELFINVIDLSENPRSFEELGEDAPNEIAPFLNDFKIYKQEESLLGGKRAHLINYSGKMKFGRQKDMNLKHLKVSTLIDNIYYSIDFSHGIEFFDNYKELCNEMFESFEFI